jgi:hypothetical protein
MRKRTYNPNWFHNDARKEHCLAIADAGESLFAKLTNSKPSTLEEDLQHMDCFWDGKAVDVKGLKPMHVKGFVLLEFINIWGKQGWCSRTSKAELIAFQFPEVFYVFKKDDLRDYAISVCPPFDINNVWRDYGIQPEDALHKWVGRLKTQDVFTYCTIGELNEIIYDVIAWD